MSPMDRAKLRIKTGQLIASDREAAGRSAVHLRAWESQFIACARDLVEGLRRMTDAMARAGW